MFHRNRFAYYGDGWTEVERYKGDIVSYMDHVDLPPIPTDDEEHHLSTVVNGQIDFGNAVKTKHTAEGPHNPVPAV
jgi:hypothetical protein